MNRLLLTSSVLCRIMIAAPSVGQSVTCRTAAVPVVIARGSSGTYTVSGELCATASEQRAGTTVQVLLHGATYNYGYWDFVRFDGAESSYSRDVAAGGFATFAYDALGSGNSSHPSSDQLTLQSAAQVAHQVVQALRSGSIGGVRFGKIILVGHSLGAVVAWEEAISYRDVDGLIVTGAAHSLSSRFQAAKPFYPAVNDPAFTARGLDAGYLTTTPGVRAGLFYSDPNSDPVGSIADEVFKDVVPAIELMSAIPIIRSAATLAIQVPVLIILGSDDLLTCGPNPQGGSLDCSSAAAVVAQEAPFYSPQARMIACVIPGSGHAISLSMNHRLQAIDAVAWSREFIDQPGRSASGDLPSNCR